MRHVLIALLLLAGAARADEIRASGAAAFVYHQDHPTGVAGVLTIEWTDTADRVIERRSIPFDDRAGPDISFSIDLRRAVVMGNALRAQVTAGGVSAPTVEIGFIAPARKDPWSDWQTMLYQARSPAQLAGLRQIGLTGGMIFANRTAPAQIDAAAADGLVHEDLRWYVENIATDYYAQYHRWRPDRTENADLLDAKRLHQQAPRDLAAFTRVPSLSDPGAFEPIGTRLAATVKAYAPYHPLYYSLADEPGIADLAAAWDFDFSAASLTGLRAWLQTHYASLDALNDEWSSHFANWADVVPATTDQAMHREDGNFAAWADFKAWMDEAFARAVRAGTDAVHAADPVALSAIEGAQIPGWGGYDYSLLSTAVDAMEIYDFAENVDMARSFNPDLVMVSTIGTGDDRQVHALWRSLLRGMRGAIIWDETDSFANPDGSLGVDGRRFEPAFRALRDGFGALLINSKPDPAPISILYSPASFRTEWMLDQKPRGPAWAARDAEAEYGDTAMRAATRGFTKLLGHLGLQGRFISPEMLARGALGRDGTRALILPHVLALSNAEAAAIRAFAASGGAVIADIVPGAFDAHSRERPQAALAGLFPSQATLFSPGGGGDREALDRLAAVLGRAGITADLRLTGTDGERVTDVTVYRYRQGSVLLYALHRDLPGDGAVTLALSRPRFAAFPQGGHPMGLTTDLTVKLGSVTPAFLALSDIPFAGPEIASPVDAQRGQDALAQVRISRWPAVLHMQVKTPDGHTDLRYSGNVLAPNAHAVWRIPLALNDPVGAWSVTATDMATGQSVSTSIAVR